MLFRTSRQHRDTCSVSPTMLFPRIKRGCSPNAQSARSSASGNAMQPIAMNEYATMMSSQSCRRVSVGPRTVLI